MKRLIVNADDFGLTGKVNEAIIEGHANGIITSTTLMANGGAFESAVALVRQQPRLGVGVHLNLTEGRPVAAAARIPSLVGPAGFLQTGPGRLARGLVLGRVRRADIEREARAQIEKILAAGVRPTHIDGHKHVHLAPGLFGLVARLAKEYGIGAVRRPAERSVGLIGLLRRNAGSRPAILKQRVMAILLAAGGLGCRVRLRRDGLTAPARFYGVTQTGFLDEAALSAILRAVPEGTSEIMCHPGYVDADLKATPTRLLAQRETELRALTSPAIRALVGTLSIELIHYGHLTGAP